MLTASAAIIEVTYFRRLSIITLMVSATFLSLGGTGITMLLVAFPSCSPASRLDWHLPVRFWELSRW
jgi:hypothetical protein